jgi:2-methylcitrate dehydratase PrpD
VPSDIHRVQLTGHPLMQMLAEPAERKRAPVTAIDAKFSAYYCFAHALVHGHVGLDSFDAACLRDPVVLALAQRIEFRADAAAALHAMSGGSTQLWFTSGREWQCKIAHPRGSAASPLSEHELIAKFQTCARRALVPLPETSLEPLIETVLQLEQITDLEAALLAPLRGHARALR